MSFSGGGTGGNTRPFSIIITGIGGSKVTLQRSFGIIGAWVDVETYDSDVSKNFDDGFDNQIVYYQLIIKPGNYVAPDSIDATLVYPFSVQKGIVRITKFLDSQNVEAEVVKTLGKDEATSEWDEGAWSAYRGFPSSVAFHDGRLVWGFQDSVYMSVSDAFDSYDDQTEGDSGPVVRSVATGPVEGIRWLLSVQRLLVGTGSQEVSIRASQFDEPITPTQFTAREFSNRGCANIQAVKVDAHGIFVQRNSRRVYLMSFSSDNFDYTSQDATRLDPRLFEALANDRTILGMAVQRQPDTRVWMWLDDGTAATLTYEPADEVIAWTTITTDGNIRAIGILPATEDDSIYLAVERSPVTGSIMAIEKLALMREARPGTLVKCIDSHVVYEGAATDTISVPHLKGLSVVAWGDGVPIPGPFIVNAGTGDVVLSQACENVVVGLAYDGKFKSAKLAHGGQSGTAISQRKRIDHASLLMASVGWYGVFAGHDFDTMSHLARTLGNGRILSLTESLDTYDHDYQPFNGGWGPDERVCFKVSSPYPATFLGVSLRMTATDPAAFGFKGKAQG